jgi:hypothetical protein
MLRLRAYDIATKFKTMEIATTPGNAEFFCIMYALKAWMATPVASFGTDAERSKEGDSTSLAVCIFQVATA